MIGLNDIERLQKATAALLKERRAMARMSDKIVGSMTAKANDNLQAKMDDTGMEIIRLTAITHAAAVDCGVADIRDAARYAPRVLRTRLHEHHFEPPRPRALATNE